MFSGIFRKYDGFIYPKPGIISWDRFFPTGSAMNDRRAFFKKFFPKWSGFCVDSFDKKLKLMEALENLDYLINGTSLFWTSTSKRPHCNPVDKQKLKLGKVTKL